MKQITLQSPKACMGGWCKRRESCPNFLSPDRRHPAERICGANEGTPKHAVRLSRVVNTEPA